jgi:OPT family oligopeptide transporter
MAALPFQFTGDEALLEKAPQDASAVAPPPRPGSSSSMRNPVAPPAQPRHSVRLAAPKARELTVRALLVGGAIGAILAAGNVYTSLKSTFIDGGALTATLLSFGIFATFRKYLRAPFGPLENNTAQTVSASAAVMAWVHGLMGPIPALQLLGYHPGMWAVWLWGMGIAVVGILVAVALRPKLIDEDDLPFPSGVATAALVEAIHADQQAAFRRARLMMLAALGAMAVTWLRDGRPSVIPGVVVLPFAIAGISAATLTIGVAASPLMMATGVMMGTRTAVTLLLGGLFAWGGLVPVAHHAGWIVKLDYSSLAAWLVWPALGMMLASAIVPAVLGAGRFATVLMRFGQDARNGLRAVWTPISSRDDEGAPVVTRGQIWRSRGLRILGWGAILAIPIGLAVVGWLGFGYAPKFVLLSLVASVILGGICARAAGETDIAPVGQMGTLAQIVSSAGGPVASLLSGSIVAGSTTQTAQSLWAFRAGRNLGASPRSQIVAQLFGAFVGALVVVPTYVIVTRVYGIGTEQMPAATALSWKATSQALSGGLSSGSGDRHGWAAAIAFIVGTVFTLLGRRPRWEKYVPSPTALGIAFLTPVSLTACATVGALAAVVARRRMTATASPTTTAADIEGSVGALAAGALAGESLMGVVIAILAAAGILH